MIAAADINRQQGLGSLHLFRLVQELCVCESLNLYPSNQYRCLGWRVRQQTACPEEVQPQENVGFTWRWWQRSGHFGTSGHGPVCLQGANPLLPVLSGEGQPPQYRRHGPPVASRPSVHAPPQLVLIVPNWPHMALFSDIPLLICGAPRELRFWRDLLAQAQRTLCFALSPETLALDLASERTSFLVMHLSRMVVQTLQGAWGCKTAADSVWPSCQLRGL